MNKLPNPILLLISCLLLYAGSMASKPSYSEQHMPTVRIYFILVMFPWQHFLIKAFHNQ
jgi:hypothetical protein